MNAAFLAAIGGYRRHQFADATDKITMDGNSLVFGYRNPGPGNTIAQQVVSQSGSPLYGSGITITNLGVSGQTWAQMLTGLPSYTSGKTNWVIAWEGTNSIANSRTAQQALDDAAAYVTAVKGVNAAIRMVGITCLPRQGQFAPWGTIAAFNAELDSYNALLRQHYADIGFERLCDVRQSGGVWDMGGDYSDSSFASCDTRAGGTVWLEGSNSRVHMTDFGDGILAGYLGTTLRGLRA